MEITPKIQELLQRLEEKYQMEGQQMETYLEGLVYNNYLDYWDYIHLEALINLQHPRTDIPDENIFIIYHQITELYFKLSLLEIDQILKHPKLDAVYFTAKLKRLIAYFTNLTHSFEIMVNGMAPEQFLKFRLSLLPASGFQSVQYRMIEIASTDMINLVEHPFRSECAVKNSSEQYEFIYWKKGASDAASGKKTLTLRRFEEKYKEQLTSLAKHHEGHNLYAKFKSLSADEQSNPALLAALKEYDGLVNVHWPNVHLKSAGRYLAKPGKAIAATGGTNWESYLPPKIQRRVFFPSIWDEQELENWGK